MAILRPQSDGGFNPLSILGGAALGALTGGVGLAGAAAGGLKGAAMGALKGAGGAAVGQLPGGNQLQAMKSKLDQMTGSERPESLLPEVGSLEGDRPLAPPSMGIRRAMMERLR